MTAPGPGEFKPLTFAFQPPPLASGTGNNNRLPVSTVCFYTDWMDFGAGKNFVFTVLWPGIFDEDNMSEIYQIELTRLLQEFNNDDLSGR
jgi:hypothetical protein